jgi:hypothetical protein
LEKLLNALEGTLGDGAEVHLNVDLEMVDLDLLLVLQVHLSAVTNCTISEGTSKCMSKCI